MGIQDLKTFEYSKVYVEKSGKLLSIVERLAITHWIRKFQLIWEITPLLIKRSPSAAHCKVELSAEPKDKQRSSSCWTGDCLDQEMLSRRMFSTVIVRLEERRTIHVLQALCRPNAATPVIILVLAILPELLKRCDRIIHRCLRKLSTWEEWTCHYAIPRLPSSLLVQEMYECK